MQKVVIKNNKDEHVKVHKLKSLMGESNRGILENEHHIHGCNYSDGLCSGVISCEDGTTGVC